MTLRAVLALCLLAMPAQADETGSQPDLLLTEWTLVQVDGQDVGYQATLNLDDPARITGQGPCNRYFATVEGPLPSFRLTGLGATKMACPDMAAESAYFGLLAGVDNASLGETEISLSGSGHVLTFERPLN